MAVNSFNAQNPPVTTKGDVFTFSTIPTRLGVGANDTVLTADSTAATGLKWATPASGAFTQIATGSLSSTSVTISSIPGTYRNLHLLVEDYKAATAQALQVKPNNSSCAHATYSSSRNANVQSGNAIAIPASAARSATTSSVDNSSYLIIYNYAGTAASKSFQVTGLVDTSLAWDGFWAFGGLDLGSAVTSLVIEMGAATMNAGTYTLWGEK